MRKLSVVALSGLMVIGLSFGAEAAIRVRGDVVAAHGKKLVIATYSGKTDTLTLGPRTRFVVVARARSSDIKPGEFVGIGATGPKSHLKALEAVIFPAAMRGTGEGHYKWSVPATVADSDLQRTTSGAASAPPVKGSMTNGTVASAATPTGAPPVKGTMTNGTVSGKATAAGGKRFTVSYKGGKVRILVPATAPVVHLVVSQRSIVKPGAKAFVVAAKSSDGVLKAKFVAVGKNGMMPPM